MNFIVPLVVFPFDVMVSLGETDEQIKKALGKFDIEWKDEMQCFGQGRFFMTENNQSVIRTKVFPTSCEDYGHLQHEIFHSVTMLLDRIGMVFKPLESDECYAYLIGYLTTEIYKKINQ